MKPKAFVFDAYGTLFDVHSVVARAGNNIPGDLEELAALWRQKQLEYTWLRSLMERYEDFWEVTRAALRSAIMQLKIEASGKAFGYKVCWCNRSQGSLEELGISVDRL
jgi:2-haloacid dehalogenase